MRIFHGTNEGVILKMKKIILISILSILTVASIIMPSFALSDRAEDFLKACRMYDVPFPPENWSKDDLRAAAIEVLDEVEAGRMSYWPKSFCLITLGYVKNPDDLPRILSYEDDMPSTVLRSLKGFSHPDAINFLIKYLDHERDSRRELAVMSLAVMDFNKLENPWDWYNKVYNELSAALKREKEDWLRKDIEKAIQNLKKPAVKNT